MSAQTIAVGEAVSVDVDVTNTGARDGEEVAQLYIHQRHGRSSRPVRELKGFRRVAVPAGRTITVEFGLGPDELSYWSAASRTHVQDSSTTVDVYVGGSSLAEATTSFEVR